MRAFISLSVLTALAILIGCGHDRSNDSASSPPPMESGPARGQLLTVPPAKVSSYTTTDLLTQLGLDSLGKQLISISYSAACSIDVYQLEYETVGAQGEATTASGALMVPTGTDATCQGPRPVVVYAHGTAPDKNFNIADLTASGNSEGLILAAVATGRALVAAASASIMSFDC